MREREMSVASMESSESALRILFETGTLSGLDDGRLLELFRHGEADVMERAFAVLVERHGPMVLGVCEAVLRNRQDAEDAFQAVFLVLAQRSGTIRRGTAVASWLYGVARRISLRTRRTLARRRRLEAKRIAAERGPVAVDARIPCPELYEELDRLPAVFRAAVILCDLEGVSYGAAASQLGCPLGTLQSRLARGRQRLRARLERRGLGPDALASSVPIAGMLTPSLARQVARAAVSAIVRGSACGPATVAASAMAAAEWKRAFAGRSFASVVVLGIVVAVSSGAFLVGGRDGEAIAREEKQTVASPTKPDSESVYIRVLDERGKAVPRQDVRGYSIIDDMRGPWSYTTNAEGDLAIPKEKLRHPQTILARRGVGLLLGATAGNEKIDGQQWTKGTRDDPYLLEFQPLTRPIEGRVVDPQGRPIQGVRVVAQDVKRVRIQKLVTSLSVYNLKKTILRVEFMGNLRIPGLPEAFTDEAGRFRILLPEGATVTLRPYHDRYFGRVAKAEPETTSMDPLVMQPAGSIVGRIVEAKTGRPVPGARAYAAILESGRDDPGFWTGPVDDTGHFQIRGLAPGVYALSLGGLPDRRDLSAGIICGLRVRAGQSVSADLEVASRRPLRGIVVEPVTGAPAAGVWVQHLGPEDIPNRGEGRVTKTDPRGGFEFQVIPGAQALAIVGASDPKGELHETIVVVPEEGVVRPVKLLREPGWAEADSGAEEMHKEEPVQEEQKSPNTHPVPRSRTLTGHVRDPNGRSLPNVAVTSTGDELHAYAVTDRDGTFIMENMPSEGLRLKLSGLRHVERVVVAPSDRDEMDVTLAPRPVRGTGSSK